MKKKTPKIPREQIEITADLLGRTMHHLGELGIPYALVIEGVHKVFSNVHEKHAFYILVNEAELQMAIKEKKRADLAEKLSDVFGEEDPGFAVT